MQPRNRFLTFAAFFFLPFLILPARGNSEKIEIVASHSVGAYNEVIQGFKEKATFNYAIVDLAGNPEKGREAMQQAGAANVNLVVPLGEIAVKSLSALAAPLPVVYTMVFDPIRSEKQAASGVLLKIDIKTRLVKVRQLFPNVKNIGMLFNAAFSAQEIAEARNLAPGLGMNIFALPVDNLSDMPTALKKLNRDTVDLLMLVPDVTIANPAALQAIIDHASKESVPCVGLSTYHMKAGTTAALVVDFRDIGMQTAELVEKCLAAPGTSQTVLPRKVVVYVSASLQKKLKTEMKLSPDVQMIP